MTDPGAPGAAGAETRPEGRPRWHATGYQRRLLTVGLIGVGVAVVFGVPAFAVVAAAPLWLAFSASRKRPSRIEVSTDVDLRRCLEGDTVVVSSTATADAPVTFDAFLPCPLGLTIVDHARHDDVRSRQATYTWTLRADLWGRWPIGPIVVRAATDGLLAQTTVSSGASKPLTVLPAASALRQLPLPRTLPNRLGDHVSRVVGEGVEFAGIRPLVSGDQLRHLNWRATARYRRPYVTRFNAERACELVIVVDGISDVGPHGSSSLDIAVRGAAALAQSYLADHDRVGVIAMGGALHWVAGQSGTTQFYRVVEALLDVRDFVSVVKPAVDRLPRAVLPAGSLVVMFSPLLDERAIEVARDLRQRRFPLVVIDVLAVEPRMSPPTRTSELAFRMWRLQRRATRSGLADLGVHVIDWNGRDSLDTALGALPMAGRIA